MRRKEIPIRLQKGQQRYLKDKALTYRTPWNLHLCRQVLIDDYTKFTFKLDCLIAEFCARKEVQRGRLANPGVAEEHDAVGAFALD